MRDLSSTRNKCFKLHVSRFMKLMSKRRLIGTVVSDKMQKTVVVKVERIKAHPKYKRRFRVHKKYKAHDEKGEYHVGDRVVIEECRPLSREKKWKVIQKI